MSEFNPSKINLERQKRIEKRKNGELISEEEKKESWENIKLLANYLSTSDPIYFKVKRVVNKLRNLEKSELLNLIEIIKKIENKIKLNREEENFLFKNDFSVPWNLMQENLDLRSFILQDVDKVKIYSDISKFFNPDIKKGSLIYTGKKFFTTDRFGGSVPTCTDNEYWNINILKGEEDFYKNKGIVFKLENNVIGYVKLRGEQSFLASRTVYDNDGKILFLKGMIYSIDKRIYKTIQKYNPYSKKENNWSVFDLEKVSEFFSTEEKQKGVLRFRHVRMIVNEDIYDYLDKFNESFDQDNN